MVLDRNGRAWQRLDPHRENAPWQRHRWQMAGAVGTLFGTAAQPWSYLVVDLGPLTILYRASSVRD